MARSTVASYRDPAAELGTVKNETAEQARRRRRKEFQNEVDDRALELVENDPEVEGDLTKARAKARELIALERAYNSGAYDPSKKPKKKTGKNAASPKGESSARRRSRNRGPSPRRTRSTSRPAGRRNGFVARSVNLVAAPYGSAASAAWTIGMGGLSLVLLYSLLSREGSSAVAALSRAISSGLRRFADPYAPLLASRAESAPPPPTRRRRANAKPPIKTASSGPYGNKPLVK